jgi:hypothetical protein
MSRFPGRALWAVVFLVACLVGRVVPAAPRHAKTHAKKAAPRPLPLPPKRGEVAKVPSKGKGKLAVFAFEGDDDGRVRKQVVRVLRGRGFKVNTSLRRVDSAEQYREMAAALNLAGYVDGEVNGDGKELSATVQLRSGVTGTRAGSASFAGDRRALAADLGKNLWTRMGPALVKAGNEAAKPRKPERAPMRIDAGTPIETTPREVASRDVSPAPRVPPAAPATPPAAVEVEARQPAPRPTAAVARKPRLIMEADVEKEAAKQTAKQTPAGGGSGF